MQLSIMGADEEGAYLRSFYMKQTSDVKNLLTTLVSSYNKDELTIALCTDLSELDMNACMVALRKVKCVVDMSETINKINVSALAKIVDGAQQATSIDWVRDLVRGNWKE